jgi:hypothetical protein
MCTIVLYIDEGNLGNPRLRRHHIDMLNLDMYSVAAKHKQHKQHKQHEHHEQHKQLPTRFDQDLASFPRVRLSAAHARPRRPSTQTACDYTKEGFQKGRVLVLRHQPSVSAPAAVEEDERS